MLQLQHEIADIPPVSRAVWRNALLLSIPLWVLLGIVPIAVFQEGPLERSTILALTVALVCEAILARPYLQNLGAKFRRDKSATVGTFRRHPGGHAANDAHLLNDLDSMYLDLEKRAGRRLASIEDLLRYVGSNAGYAAQPRYAPAPPSLMRQTIALSALVGAYLQYYFLEVNLQIAALNSITVFIPLSSVT